MELHPEVDVPADGLADRGEARNEVVDAGGLTHQVVLVLEQEDLQRRVALVVDRSAGSLDYLIGGAHLEHDLHGADRAPRSPPRSCQTGTSKCFPLRSQSAWSSALIAPVIAMPRKLSARYRASQ